MWRAAPMPYTKFVALLRRLLDDPGVTYNSAPRFLPSTGGPLNLVESDAQAISNWQEFEGKASADAPARRRASFPMSRHYADGKASAAGELKASLISALYFALRKKASTAGKNALTEDGFLRAGGFTWEDLRSARQDIPDLDTLATKPKACTSTSTMPPPAPQEEASQESDSSSSLAASSCAPSATAEPSLLDDAECFLQNIKVHFTHHADVDGRRLPWCRRRGRPYNSDPQATGVGLSVAAALGDLCSGCVAAAGCEARRGTVG